MVSWCRHDGSVFGALSLLLFAACAQPCPEAPAFCMQVDAGTCVAWPAGCCDGLQLCKRDATPVTDAGACTMLSTPASEAIVCP
jgi:hypothetical protein